MTSDETSASRDIIDEHLVNVSYADPEGQRYVSVSGRAAILHDPARQEKLWRSEFARYFPRGLADPHLALLRVRIESAEYWDVMAGRMRPVHEHGGSGGPADEAGDSEASAERSEAAESGNGDEHGKVDLRPIRRPR